MEKILIQISESFTVALQQRYEEAIEAAPFVLGAVVVFLFGLILAELVSRTILGLGKRLKLEVLSEKLGLKHFLEKRKSKISPLEVIARSAKAYLIFLFFLESTQVAGLIEVSEFLERVNDYIPRLIIATFIMLVGVRFANTAKLLIRSSMNFTKSNTSNILSLAIYYMVVTFAVLAALSQLQIAEILIQALFIGFISMLALAGGLAFGLGGKEVVKELLEDIKNMELKIKK